MKPAFFLLQTVLLLLFSGCYTQFVVVDRAPPPETVEYRIDTLTGDTVKVIRQMDTIRTKDRETCVWERDLLGYPHLRCYDSYYPHDWFWYNNSPWWYRNDPYWYDYNRCPRYYYYDPSCGCCRYTGSSFYRRNDNGNPYRQGSGSSSFQSGAGGSSINPRVEGIQDASRGSGIRHSSPTTSSSSTASSSGRQAGSVVIPSNNKQPISVINGRISGVPESSSGAQPIPSGATAPAPKPPSASVNQQQPPPPTAPAAVPPPPPPSSSESQNTKDNDRRERNNTRSW